MSLRDCEEKIIMSLRDCVKKENDGIVSLDIILTMIHCGDDVQTNEIGKLIRAGYLVEGNQDSQDHKQYNYTRVTDPDGKLHYAISSDETQEIQNRTRCPMV